MRKSTLSTLNLSEIIFQQGLFQFEDGNNREGIIEPSYNIGEGKIEYYFIAQSHLMEFNRAEGYNRKDALHFYGQQITASNIMAYSAQQNNPA